MTRKARKHWLRSTLALLLLGAAWPCFAECTKESCPVLVIDFTGNMTHEPLAHADQFIQMIMPEAMFHTIGNHGVLPDDLRNSAGYSAIIKTGTPADVEASAARVYGLTRTHSRVVLAFDMNELIPNQVREELLPWLPAFMRSLLARQPNKTDPQAAVAAHAIARWKAANPDGKVVIRGHSDGTYSALATLRHLKQNGLAVDSVIVESVRQQYDEWWELAKFFTGTLFIDISARNDLPPIEQRHRLASPAFLPNWRHLHLTEDRSPWEAHSATADYFHVQGMERSDHLGTRFLDNATLGGAVRDELLSVFDTGAQHMLRSRGLDGRTHLAPPEFVRARREAQADLKVAKQGVPVWQEAAVEYMNTLRKLATAIAEKQTVAWGQPSDQTAAVLRDLAQAVQKDIDENHGGRFVFLRSHTLEKIGEWGLNLIEQIAQHDVEKFKNISPWLAVLDEMRAFTIVLARVAGGQYEAEDVKAIVAAETSLVKKIIVAAAELELKLENTDSPALQQSLRQLKAQLLVFDGFGDMAQAIALRGEAGLWTIEAADKLSDALITMGASLIAIRLTAGRRATGRDDITPFVRDVIVATNRFARDATRGSAVWSWLYSRTYGNRFLILDAYAQYQLSQVLRGERVLDIDTLFDIDELHASGFTRTEIARSKHQTRLLNAHTAMHAARVQPETPQGDGRDSLTIVTRKTEKIRLPEPAKLKPWRNDSLLAPPRRGGPPGGADDPGDASGSGAGGSDGGDDSGGGSLKGVTVNPDPQFERIDPATLKHLDPSAGRSHEST